MSPHDLIIEQEVKQGPEGHTKTKTTFIEVKSTRYPDRHVFNISLNEWAFCTAEPARYDVYRVYNAGNLRPFLSAYYRTCTSWSSSSRCSFS